MKLLSTGLAGVAGLACMLAWAAVHAASPIRLDDSGSHTVPPNVQMQWRHVPGSSRGGGRADVMEATVRVAVQIDTSAHAGKTGRIYMVLPADGGSALAMEWQSDGRLLPGRLRPGERALVYQGPLPEARLADQLRVLVQSDGQWATASRRLSVHFELEI
jgi:hypothetical protein